MFCLMRFVTIVLVSALSMSVPLPLIGCSRVGAQVPQCPMMHRCPARNTLTIRVPAVTIKITSTLPHIEARTAPRAIAADDNISEPHAQRSTYYAPLATIQLRI